MSKCTAAQAVEAMSYWVGYYEKASSSYAQTRAKSAFTKNKGSNNYTYAGYKCGTQGQPWCASQVTTAIAEACGSNADAKIVMHGVYPYVNCAQLWDAAPDDMRFWGDYQRFTLGKGNRTRYKPVAGDVAVFTDNKVSRSHTGMVYDSDDTYVYTIEGNSGNMCRKRSYRRDSSYIYGYVKPKYAAASTTPNVKTEQYGAVCKNSPKLHVLDKGCAGFEVKTMQRLLIVEGFSCGDKADDGEFGTKTEEALIAFQIAKNILVDGKADGICGSRTWDVLLTGEE